MKGIQSKEHFGGHYETHDCEVNIFEILKDVDSRISIYGLEVVLKEYSGLDREKDIHGHPSFDFWIERKGALRTLSLTIKKWYSKLFQAKEAK